MRGNLIYSTKLSLLFILYFITAKLGLAFDAVSGFASLVWAPSGIALVFILLGGYSLWPAIFTGAFLVNWLEGAPWFVALGIGVGNTAEAMVGVYFLKRFVHFQSSLERIQDVFDLLIFVSLMSTFISAMVGVGSLWAGDVISVDSLVPTFRAWWIGDMLGDLVVAPLLLTWKEKWEIPVTFSQAIELILFFITLILVSWFIFVESPFLAGFFRNYPVSFLMFPHFIWSALRLGPRWTTTAIFLASVIAIGGTVYGLGPYARGVLSVHLLFLQMFMGVSAITSLLLAAAVKERKKTEQTLRSANMQLAAWAVEEKRAEEELKETTEALVRSNKELEQFAYIASHDLQEPLRKIMAYGEVLLEDYGHQLNPEGQEFIQTMRKAALRMQDLIQSLLYYSRLKKGKSLELVDLNKIVLEICSDLEVMVKEAGATIEVKNLPVLRAEPTQMRQLFQNLIANALKYTKKDGVVPHKVVVESHGVDAKWITITVSDNGIGVPKKFLESIFEPFRRLHSQSEYQGVGMGLAICKKIVERHGGSISVDSEFGFGSTFTIHWPRS